MSTIFLDRDKLSPRYLPKNLLHRDQQVKMLNSIYADLLDKPREIFLRVSQVVGGVGTGKTSTVRRFGLKLEEEAIKRKINFKFVYVNCKVDGTKRFVLYGNMLRKVAPQIATESLSPEDMLHQLVSFLDDRKMYVLLAFDEIDYFLKASKEHLIYDMTRLPELRVGEPIPVLGEIFISRDLSHYERLEPSEISTLGRGVIDFPKYRFEEIKDILYARVEEAFRSGALNEDIIDFISRYVASQNGDIRIGLDLLLYSGYLAENLGYDRILPDHVRRVIGETNPSITTEDILDLDENLRLTLLGLARILRFQKTSYARLRDILQSYKMACEEYNITPKDEIDEYIEDLAIRGLVDIESLTKIGISGGSAEDVERFLEQVMKREGRNEGT
jgi:cell division control protein 6